MEGKRQGQNKIRPDDLRTYLLKNILFKKQQQIYQREVEKAILEIASFFASDKVTLIAPIKDGFEEWAVKKKSQY